MRVPVLWCSHHADILARGYADQGFLEAMLDRSVWSPPDAVTFDHHEVREDFPCTRCGRGHQLPHPCQPEGTLSGSRGNWDRLDWAVVLLCGDEEWVFPWQEVPETERRKVWVMQARPEHAHLSGFLPAAGTPAPPTTCATPTQPTDGSTGSSPARSTTFAGKPASTSWTSSTAA